MKFSKKSLENICFQKQIILLLLVVFLVSCSVPENKVCTADRDCVPDACCHATDTVNTANKPDCSGLLCTMNCEPGTLDCGQGEIKCLQGSCQVVWQE
ncbi:MAG: hypothetical protein KKH52_00055 [Nanoarchaeota archaeon]|nr:hypothetical protein [Nanoarchaeota archaeon]